MEMRTADMILRTGMMKMWKDIFQDREEYITLFFDNYFSPGNVFYRLNKDAKLIAMMFAIPCDFKCDYLSRPLRALYLCGLATDVVCRGRGIMTDMIKNVNIDARNRGFDFTFLIPADAYLRTYYYRLGYKNNMKRRKVIFTKDICKGINCGFSVMTYYDVIDEDVKGDICKYALQSERSCEGVNIIRTLKDWSVILTEHLQSGGRVIVSRDSVSGPVNGIVFYNTDGVEVKVSYMYSESSDTARVLLGHIFNTEKNINSVILSEYIPGRMSYLFSWANDISFEDYGMSYLVMDCENSKSETLYAAVHENQKLINLRDVPIISDLLRNQINISMMLD